MKISKYFTWINSKLNVWSFWHLLGGLFLTKVFYWLGYVGWLNIILVFAMALIWEVIEWRIEKWYPYGSVAVWKQDTFLDVFIATACAWWVML